MLLRQCRSKIDLSGKCRKCGQEGYIARNWEREPLCMFCKVDNSKFANHMRKVSAISVCSEFAFEEMRGIQINLNHCEAARDLLTQRVREENIEAVIISDPYGNNTWITDKSTTAAIWICDSLPFQQVYTNETDFVKARIKGVFVYSCYAPLR